MEEFFENRLSLLGFFCLGKTFWRFFLFRFIGKPFELAQAALSKDTEKRPLGTQGQIIIEFKGSLESDGLTIDVDESLSGEVFNPILVLAEKDLGMLIEDGWMLGYTHTSGSFQW